MYRPPNFELIYLLSSTCQENIYFVFFSFTCLRLLPPCLQKFLICLQRIFTLLKIYCNTHSLLHCSIKRRLAPNADTHQSWHHQSDTGPVPQPHSHSWHCEAGKETWVSRMTFGHWCRWCSSGPCRPFQPLHPSTGHCRHSPTGHFGRPWLFYGLGQV